MKYIYMKKLLFPAAIWAALQIFPVNATDMGDLDQDFSKMSLAGKSGDWDQSYYVSDRVFHHHDSTFTVEGAVCAGLHYELQHGTVFLDATAPEEDFLTTLHSHHVFYGVVSGTVTSPVALRSPGPDEHLLFLTSGQWIIKSPDSFTIDHTIFEHLTLPVGSFLKDGREITTKTTLDGRWSLAEFKKNLICGGLFHPEDHIDKLAKYHWTGTVITPDYRKITHYPNFIEIDGERTIRLKLHPKSPLHTMEFLHHALKPDEFLKTITNAGHTTLEQEANRHWAGVYDTIFGRICHVPDAITINGTEMMCVNFCDKVIISIFTPKSEFEATLHMINQLFHSGLT
jgi:hypothetical protein